MSRLFAFAGVDYVQWKAVSRTLLRSDFRAPPGLSTELYSLRSVRQMLSMALIYGLFGAAAAVIIVLNPDVLLTGTITLTYLTFSLATSLLTQHGATMLADADFAILAPRPVTSRTFFAIRLTNVLFHTALRTTFMAYPPVIAYTLAHGFSLARGLAAAVAIYLWSATVTFAVVASYAALLRWVGGARLQRAIAYVQLAAGLVAYAGFFVSHEVMGGAGLATVTMPDTAALLFPPAWFASYIELATPAASVATGIRTALSLALLGGLTTMLGGRLSLDYAERLSESPVSEPRAVSRREPGRPWLFARDESRAVALLVVSHFRHDMRVRMGLFGVVPLLLMYVVLGMRQAGNADPFLGVTRGQGADFLAMAALMFPAIVTRQLETSDAYRAAWIYRVTTAHHGRLVVALKNVAIAYFLAPFSGVLFAIFTWRFGHAGHAAAHTALLTAFAHLALQTAVLLSPRLPFSQPPNKSGGTTMFVWMIGVLVGGQLMLVGVQRFIYPHWPRVAGLLAALLALSWAVEWAIRYRANGQRMGRSGDRGIG